MPTFLQTLKDRFLGWLNSKPLVEHIHAELPIIGKLFDVLHTFGVTGDHVTTVVGKSIELATHASDLTGADKLNAVAQVARDTVDLASKVGVEGVASAAKIIAETAYQIAKMQGQIPTINRGTN